MPTQLGVALCSHEDTEESVSLFFPLPSSLSFGCVVAVVQKHAIYLVNKTFDTFDTGPFHCLNDPNSKAHRQFKNYF